MSLLRCLQLLPLLVLLYILSQAQGKTSKLSPKCQRYLCQNIYRTNLRCICNDAQKRLHTRLCADDDMSELLTILAQVEDNTRFERFCGEIDLSVDKDSEEGQFSRVRVKRLRSDESPVKDFKYKEYPVGKTNMTIFHALYADAFTRKMEKRILSAVYRGTAIDKFSKESRGPSRRIKRSTSMFDNSVLGTKSIYYYEISNAPGFSQQSITIAAALSDWAAKAPFCFRERVSSQEPSADFSIDFLDDQNFGNEHSRTTSISGKRHVQFNNYYGFISGNARPGVPREVSLDAVMLHEAGHLLGIPHSVDPSSSSAMYTNYDPNDSNNLVDDYERQHVQQLYGKCVGTTDAMTHIRFAVNGISYTNTYICRENAVWEYSYTLNRAIGNPIRTEQLFSEVYDIIDAMVHVDSGPAENFPLVHVFKGTLAHTYRYDHNRYERMVYSGSVNILALTQDKLSTVDAAFWSDDASRVYLFSGNKVCSFKGNWNLMKCTKINVSFPGLTNSPIDAAYQMPKATNGPTQCMFFRGHSVYIGEYSSASGWYVSYSGTVPNQSGYVWQDLCENLC